LAGAEASFVYYINEDEDAYWRTLKTGIIFAGIGTAGELVLETGIRAFYASKYGESLANTGHLLPGFNMAAKIKQGDAFIDVDLNQFTKNLEVKHRLNPLQVKFFLKDLKENGRFARAVLLNDDLVKAWEVLPANLRTNIEHLVTTSNFRSKYPNRVDDFSRELNDPAVYPSQEAFLESVDLFEGVSTIGNPEDLFQVLENVRYVNRVGDLQGKGLSKFFRGTSLDGAGTVYPGNVNSIANGASTSSDPIVATLFSGQAKARSGGSGIITIATGDAISSIPLLPPNGIVRREREIIMGVTPTEFHAVKEIQLTLDQAKDLIREVTSYQVPIINTSSNMDQLLIDAPRMSDSQISQFYQLARQISN
jgi:hypothetical protein